MTRVDDVSKSAIATQNMLVIDSKLEIKIGVGLNSFPPTILNRGELMIPKSVAKFLGVEKGDEVVLYINLGGIVPKFSNPRAHLFSLLT